MRSDGLQQRTTDSEILQINVQMDTFNLVAKIAYVCAAGIALVVVFGMVTFNMPPFDLDKLEQLQSGMTKAEVKLVLGDPSSDEDKSKFQWTYAGWGWPVAHIHFDVNERFESSEYDY